MVVQQCSASDGRIYGGHHIEKVGTAGLTDLIVSEQFWKEDGKLIMRLTDARSELGRSLRKGVIQAHGFPRSGGRRALIPSYEWRDLILSDDPKCGIIVYNKRHHLEVYDDVALGRDEILENWPDGGGVKRTGLPGRPSMSKDWIEHELERRIKAGEITSKTTLAATAKSILDSLPRDYVRPTVRTIENNIRIRFNGAKASAQQP